MGLVFFLCAMTKAFASSLPPNHVVIEQEQILMRAE
jgi:hypothetical protein